MLQRLPLKTFILFTIPHHRKNLSKIPIGVISSIYILGIYKMKERGLAMLTHSAIIAIVAYVAMVYAMKQPAMIAENRSLLVGSVALVYMLLFGHGLPTGKISI